MVFGDPRSDGGEPSAPPDPSRKPGRWKPIVKGGAACLPLLFWMGKGGSPGPMGIGVAQNNHPRRRQEKEEDSIVFGSPGFSSSISRCWRRLGEGALQARTPGGDSGG